MQLQVAVGVVVGATVVDVGRSESVVDVDPVGVGAPDPLEDCWQYELAADTPADHALKLMTRVSDAGGGGGAGVVGGRTLGTGGGGGGGGAGASCRVWGNPPKVVDGAVSGGPLPELGGTVVVVVVVGWPVTATLWWPWPAKVTSRAATAAMATSVVPPIHPYSRLRRMRSILAATVRRARASSLGESWGLGEVIESSDLRTEPLAQVVQGLLDPERHDRHRQREASGDLVL